MDGEVDYGPFLKALSGADPIQARRFAAAKALEMGWGGISKISAITGFSRNTISETAAAHSRSKLRSIRGAAA